MRGCLLVLFFVQTHAQWNVLMSSVDLVINHGVSSIDQNIVLESFMAKTYLICTYRCLRLSLIKSVYYETNVLMCHCNNETDSTATRSLAGQGILYAYVTKKYMKQKNNGDTRHYIPDGIFTDCNELLNSGYSEKALYHVQQYSRSWTDLDCFGDWTVFQRRMDGSVNFYRNWTDYVNGFGSLSGEFWLGLETLYQLTKTGNCELYIDLVADSTHPTPFGYARYSSFQIGDGETNYTLYVSGFSGNVVESFMSNHNGMQFTTTDVKNDLSSTNCANMYKGGWWYRRCHSSNLNGLYLNGSHTSFADGIEWTGTWGFYYSLLRTDMKLRCR